MEPDRLECPASPGWACSGRCGGVRSGRGDAGLGAGKHFPTPFPADSYAPTLRLTAARSRSIRHSTHTPAESATRAPHDAVRRQDAKRRGGRSFKGSLLARRQTALRCRTNNFQCAASLPCGYDCFAGRLSRGERWPPSSTRSHPVGPLRPSRRMRGRINGAKTIGSYAPPQSLRSSDRFPISPFVELFSCPPDRFISNTGRTLEPTMGLAFSTYGRSTVPR